MDALWPASALSRLPRPVPVTPCPACGADQPAGYGTCPACHDALERFWLADWRALLAAEHVAAGSADERLLAEVVVDEHDRHPFTAIDIALTLLTCPACGAELGAAYSDGCTPCALAFGNALAAEGNGGVGRLEHAWHIGRWVLRHPDRHSPTSVAGWRGAMPGAMAGALPSTAEAQRGARDLKRAMGRARR